MKNLLLSLLFTSTACILSAQVNTNSINVPNTGANPTVPPTNTYPPPQNNNLSNPSNSTVPGSNGSYTTDPAKPELGNPNTNGSYTVPYTVPPNSNQGGTKSDQKKKAKK